MGCDAEFPDEFPDEDDLADEDEIPDDEGSIDVETETFEEYEWAGQTRIRASSLLIGGYSGAGILKCSVKR